MTPPRRWLVCALVGLLSAGPACSGTSASPPAGRVATNATTAPSLPSQADSLPSTDLAAFRALLAQLRGTPVLVNFWASWCDPCKEEMPLIVEAHARYGDRVQFLGVDLLDSREGAVRFIDLYGMDFPSLFDVENQIGLHYDLFAPPMTLFIDAEGTLVAKVPGQVSEQVLEENLRAIAG